MHAIKEWSAANGARLNNDHHGMDIVVFTQWRCSNNIRPRWRAAIKHERTHVSLRQSSCAALKLYQSHPWRTATQGMHNSNNSNNNNNHLILILWAGGKPCKLQQSAYTMPLLLADTRHPTPVDQQVVCITKLFPKKNDAPLAPHLPAVEKEGESEGGSKKAIRGGRRKTKASICMAAYCPFRQCDEINSSKYQIWKKTCFFLSPLQNYPKLFGYPFVVPRLNFFVQK
jgi:hypothetical protein